MQEQAQLCRLDLLAVDVLSGRNAEFPGEQPDEMVLGDRRCRGEVVQPDRLAKMGSDMADSREHALVPAFLARRGSCEEPCQQQAQQPLGLHRHGQVVRGTAGQDPRQPRTGIIPPRVEIEQGTVRVQRQQATQDGLRRPIGRHLRRQLHQVEQGGSPRILEIDMHIDQVQRAFVDIGMPRIRGCKIETSGLQSQHFSAPFDPGVPAAHVMDARERTGDVPEIPVAPMVRHPDIQQDRRRIDLGISHLWAKIAINR